MDRVEAEFRGRLAEGDTRVSESPSWPECSAATRRSRSSTQNAGALAEERGIELTEIKDATSEDFTELVTVRALRLPLSRSRGPAWGRATFPTWSASLGAELLPPPRRAPAVFRCSE